MLSCCSLSTICSKSYICMYVCMYRERETLQVTLPCRNIIGLFVFYVVLIYSISFIGAWERVYRWYVNIDCGPIQLSMGTTIIANQSLNPCWWASKVTTKRQTKSQNEILCVFPTFYCLDLFEQTITWRKSWAKITVNVVSDGFVSVGGPQNPIQSHNLIKFCASTQVVARSST